MPATPPIVDFTELDIERVLRARQSDGVAKLLRGPRLFEQACGRMLAGILDERPDATLDECRGILRERLEIQRRLDDSGLSLAIGEQALETHHAH